MARDDDEITELVKYAELLLLPADAAQGVVAKAIADLERASVESDDFRSRRARLFRAVTEAVLKRRSPTMEVTR